MADKDLSISRSTLVKVLAGTSVLGLSTAALAQSGDPARDPGEDPIRLESTTTTTVPSTTRVTEVPRDTLHMDQLDRADDSPNSTDDTGNSTDDTTDSVDDSLDDSGDSPDSSARAATTTTTVRPTTTEAPAPDHSVDSSDDSIQSADNSGDSSDDS